MRAAELVDLVTRADVRVSRDGWVTHKRYDHVIGVVRADVNAAGQPIWRAHAGDVSAFSFTRNGAIASVLDLHNMQERARGFDILARRSKLVTA
jgi:hypothetical protein